MFYVTANANSLVQIAIQIKNGITKLVSLYVKIIVLAKKIIVGILTCICENSKHLRSFADTSVYGYCIKKDKYYSNKCYEYCLNKLSK